MTPERWQEIKQVLNSALDLAPEQRYAYLDRACSDDPSLRREVESLLDANESVRSSFMASPPPERAALSKGTKLGPYEIVSLIGAGGMGEVYRAHDARLSRAVAIKILPRNFCADTDRLRRFEQEARATAALNHPNILAVYDFDTAEQSPYVVSELLEGETLRDRLKSGPLPVRKAVDLALQAASGLAAAHDKGIVHRDLKPENLFVTTDGRIKILDFGLTKLIQAQADRATALSTHERGTKPGEVMGTVGYMSPEQVRGQATDHRCDIFAFGVILYEMLSGKRAFQGATPADIMSAILGSDPEDLSSSSQAIPPALDRIVRRCLEKAPNERFQSVRDAAFALQVLSEVSPAGHEQLNTRPLRLKRIRSWHLVLAAATLMLLLVLVFSDLPRQPRVLGYTQITELGSQTGYTWDAPLVTDGTRLYFSELVADHFVLAQVSIQGGEAVPLATPFRNTNLLDISSTGSELLVASSSGLEIEKPLWAVPVPAGSPRRLGDLLGHDGSWSPDRERLVYANGSDLYLARGDGTKSRKLVTVSGSARWPRWSADGGVLRFTVDDSHTHSSSLWQVRADGTQLRPLLPGWNEPQAECCGTWTADSRYFVFRSSHQGKPEVWAIREKQGVLISRNYRPVQLTAGPVNMRSLVPSKDGKTLFVIGTLPRGELARYDPKSRQFVPYLSGMSAEHLAFSRNGEWVCYITYPGACLWRSKADGSESLQLTFPPMQAGSPMWSPDGKRIAFFGRTPGRPWKIYLASAEGGSLQELATGERNQADPTWSPDGSVIAFDDLSNPFAIHLLELGTGKISKLVGSDGLWSPAWSPDGRFIAAKRFGSEEVLLFDFATQKWEELAHETAGYLNWSLHGNYLYFDTWLGKGAAFYKVRSSDRHIERVVSLNNLPRRTWGSWGPWTGLAPDDSLLLLHDVSSQGVYALNWDLP